LSLFVAQDPRGNLSSVRLSSSKTTSAPGVSAATSSRMNDAIADDMRPEAARWRVLDLALRSIESSRMDVSAIWAPRFRAGSWFASVPPSYWSEYAKRYNADIRFLEAPPAEGQAGVAVLDYTLDDDHGVVATLADAHKIVVALERPSTFKLGNYVLAFTDASGAVKQIPLRELSPAGPRHSVWAIEGSQAAPATVRLSRRNSLASWRRAWPRSSPHDRSFSI
jgi:hypothetical protein